MRQLVRLKAIFSDLEMKELVSTSSTTYLIGLITLGQSILVINYFGLSARGGFVGTILVSTIVSGFGTAMYEGAVPYLNGRRRNAALIVVAVLAASATGIFETVRGTSPDTIWLIVVNTALVCIAAVKIFGTISISVTRHNWLRLANYVGTLTAHIAIMALYYQPNGMPISSDEGASLLLAAWTTSNVFIVVIVFLSTISEELVDQLPSKGDKVITSGILFSVRPFFSNLDRVLIERFSSNETLGAYVTIMSTLSIGGPLINAVLQLGHHTQRHKFTVGDIIKKSVLAILVSVALFPVLDSVFFGQKLLPYWPVIFIAAAMILFLAVVRAGEILTVKKPSGYVSLALLKLGCLALVYIALAFISNQVALIAAVITILFIYTGFCIYSAYTDP